MPISEQRIAAMIEPREAAARRVFEEVVAFCQTRGGGKVFVDWPEDVLRAYLLFHMRQRTLAFVRTHGVHSPQSTVSGVGIAWQMPAADIRARAKGPADVFTWTATDPTADSLFCAEFVAADRGSLRAVATALAERFPAWRELNVFTLRRGELKQYPPVFIERLLT